MCAGQLIASNVCQTCLSAVSASEQRCRGSCCQWARGLQCRRTPPCPWLQGEDWGGCHTAHAASQAWQAPGEAAGRSGAAAAGRSGAAAAAAGARCAPAAAAGAAAARRPPRAGSRAAAVCSWRQRAAPCGSAAASRAGTAWAASQWSSAGGSAGQPNPHAAGRTRPRRRQQRQRRRRAAQPSVLRSV